jgi:hypothetical protein
MAEILRSSVLEGTRVAAWFMMGGVRFYRRSLVKLSAAERAALNGVGQADLRRPLEWPLPDYSPDFSRAYVDLGGTDLWGPGPYLKVPCQIAGDDWEPINRIFCPWGYPPDRLRIAWSSQYIQLTAVGLARVGRAEWEWVLTIVPWVQHVAQSPEPARVHRN